MQCLNAIVSQMSRGMTICHSKRYGMCCQHHKLGGSQQQLPALQHLCNALIATTLLHLQDLCYAIQLMCALISTGF
jgi:hypothetical protein